MRGGGTREVLPACRYRGAAAPSLPLLHLSELCGPAAPECIDGAACPVGVIWAAAGGGFQVQIGFPSALMVCRPVWVPVCTPVCGRPVRAAQAHTGHGTGQDTGDASEIWLKAEIINVICSCSESFPSAPVTQVMTEDVPRREDTRPRAQRWGALPTGSSVGFLGEE